jgi:DNA-binding NarL/FixJ family response regulator
MRQVLVVDDHPLILDAVRRVLERDSEWSVSEAATYSDALERMAHEPRPDLVLLDLGLPGKFGLDAVKDFRLAFPDTPCVVLSGQDQPENVKGAIELGAMGFISKRFTGEAIIDAITLVLKGYVCTPRQTGTPTPRPTLHQQGLNPMQLGLTGRQCQVLAQLVSGKSNKAIARVLDLTEATIKTHLMAIFRVLNVHNRTEAVLAVSNMGLQLALFEKDKSTDAARK